MTVEIEEDDVCRAGFALELQSRRKRRYRDRCRGHHGIGGGGLRLGAQDRLEFARVVEPAAMPAVDRAAVVFRKGEATEEPLRLRLRLRGQRHHLIAQPAARQVFAPEIRPPPQRRRSGQGGRTVQEDE